MNQVTSMSNALIDAILSGDTDKSQSFLMSGADANMRDDEGNTLLMLAANRGNLETVKLLIDAEADVNAVDANGWTALFKAVINDEQDRGFPEVVQALIDAGANIEARLAYGITPLMLAAGRGEAGVIEVLLKAGADVKARNEGGRTALMMAKDKDYVEVINQLHEAELALDDSEHQCASRNAPGAQVVTFLKH
jgi:ankyrin repeat protein